MATHAAAKKKSGLMDRHVDDAKKDRARRFEIEAPVLYRVKGETEWRKGKSSNISRTGLMFTAEDALPVGAEIEVHIVLNATVQASEAQPEANDPKGIPVTCKAEVVRNVLVPWPEAPPTIGARLQAYRFGEIT